MKLPPRGKIIDMLALPLSAIVSVATMWLAIWKLSELVGGWLWPNF